MSKFSPLFSKEYQFEGDTIKAQFSHLKRKHLDLLGDFMLDSGEELKLEIKDTAKFMEAAANILADCVKSFKGLTLDDGSEITESSPIFKEDVLGGTYFQALLMEMAVDVLNASTMSNEDEGKSQSAQPDQ